MKPVLEYRWAKNILCLTACSVWFCVAIFLGCLPVWVAMHLFQNILWPNVLWPVLLALWLGGTLLALYFPIRLMKHHRPLTARVAGTGAAFLYSMLCCIIVCTVIWEYQIDGKLYNCTDNVGFDFLHPGDWVHDFGGHPVAVVNQVVVGRSMSEPDEIKTGWSIPRLWLLWCSWFGASLLVSFVVARFWWRRGRAIFPLEGPPAAGH